ncbi:hypothetical protein Q7C36_011919 [Tachysurus vachellii]|uniref:Peptidase C1A papain C-terminal domain-containing protein n=1 Tax=Tachysurus vachellii TaxID=175792 RepID=A0AA88MSQ4_TACVA|nr:hypothetical protein Q7C36_011919 [Tachysurus vachellii]
MRILLLFTTLVALASVVSVSREDLEFNAWKLIQPVLKHNMQADQGIKSFRLGMTYFADKDNQEYRNSVFKGCLRSFSRTTGDSAATFLRGGAVLPKTVDWIKEGSVTEVKTGLLEGQTRKKTGKLVSLSEQQLVDCLWKYGNFGCMGGLMNTAFEYIRDNNGIYKRSPILMRAKLELPLLSLMTLSSCLLQDDNCRFNSDTVGATCNGYVNINSRDEKALQEAVAFIGPISVAIDAAHISFQLYKSGIYDEPDCSSTELDHGVLAVGYIKMSRNKNNQCGIATNASYPLCRSLI